jgi:FkbM family methyltransferase
MFEFLLTLRGIFRPLRIYYGNRQHGPAMDRLYLQFVRPNDLVFDIGAHVGDRVAAFRRLGANIVAVEPQPAGLGQLVQALSFEFTLIQRDFARACIERYTALGYAQFNASLGKSQTLVHGDWTDADAITRRLAALPPEANSGDIYARLA